jgi:hypothetical protein
MWCKSGPVADLTAVTVAYRLEVSTNPTLGDARMTATHYNHSTLAKLKELAGRSSRSNATER